MEPKDVHFWNRGLVYHLGIFISWKIQLCGKVDLEWNISSNSVDWFLCNCFEGAVITTEKWSKYETCYIFHCLHSEDVLWRKSCHCVVQSGSSKNSPHFKRQPFFWRICLTQFNIEVCVKSKFFIKENKIMTMW